VRFQATRETRDVIDDDATLIAPMLVQMREHRLHPATVDGVRRRELRKSPTASALGAIKQGKEEGRASGLGSDIEAPSFDPLVASEFIEACRAHLASVSNVLTCEWHLMSFYAMLPARRILCRA
jgi:hypothetical protein